MLALVSCEPATKESENASLQEEQNEPITPHAIDNIFNRISDILLVAEDVEASGSELDFGMLRMNSYPLRQDDKSQAILSGMLLSDISFLVAYDHSEAAEAYFGRLNNLIGSFSNTRAETVEESAVAFSSALDNRDSLNTLLDDLYTRATLPLSMNEYDENSAIFLSALVLENMHVNSLVIGQFPQEMLEVDKRSIIALPLVKTFMEQEPNLEETISILEEGPNTPFNQNLVSQLQEVNVKFDQLTIHEDLRNNRVDLVLADSTFIQVRDQISEARQWLFDMIQ